MSTPHYQTYRGLPELAGVCTMAEAVENTGLSIEECVGRLKRYHYAFKRLHHLFVARITAEPIYELKTAFSHHGYLCAEHVAALRERVGEMREPPLHLDVVPDANLEIFFDEILNVPTTEELLVGIYERAIPALGAALHRHIDQTHKLADAPSVRLCKFALLELTEMEAFGHQAITCLVDSRKRQSMSKWLVLLDALLAAAGALDGMDKPAVRPIERIYSATPYVYDPTPKRDERFQDSYNAGVNPEAFLYNPDYPPAPKVLMMFYKRLREIDVPEMMASIITETPGKPWGYYLAMTRQLWDEARHAMMGEVGFVKLGVDWTTIPINFTWSLNLNTQLKPWERHGVLYFIEQGLMPKTGKKFEWEVGVASQEPLSATFQDYDWADEVLHARIGREWYVKEFKDGNEARDYGDKCWSRVLSHYQEYKRRGLTEHRNWWPEIYTQACRAGGIQPDSRIAAYNETYENVRADLKEISASG
ncbi:MAG TPA: hypothetical protein VFE58_09725 [Tepidisphaeraceae bacterium]|jgi:hypothetical protein|nr:hypothetical protein [Tepidisphaeraceae bacterium]